MPTDPGLDPRLLSALTEQYLARYDLDHIRARVSAHLDAHDGYVSYSGGKDSLVTLDLTLAADPTVPVVFFDSGFEFPETRSHLRDVEDHYGIVIDRISADPPLLDLLRDDGSWDHHTRAHTRVDLHDTLITRPSRTAHERYGPGHLWGVRANESPDRARAYRHALRRACTPQCCRSPAQRRHRHGGTISRADGTTAYGPIWDWTTSAVWSYLHARPLPINTLYAKLRRIGAPPDAERVSHVIDGLRLTHGRVTWIARGWPELFNELTTALPRLREFL